MRLEMTKLKADPSQIRVLICLKFPFIGAYAISIFISNVLETNESLLLTNSFDFRVFP